MNKYGKGSLFFLGFLSFLSLSDPSNNPFSLCWIAFAGYFSYFWWAKLGQNVDEKLKHNKFKACVVSFRLCFIISFILSLLIKLSPLDTSTSFRIQLVLLSSTFAIGTNLWAFLTYKYNLKC